MSLLQQTSDMKKYMVSIYSLETYITMEIKYCVKVYISMGSGETSGISFKYILFHAL